MSYKIKFIDLFAGIGGMRLGFESACRKLKLQSECVFSSDNKKTAVDTYKVNFKDSNIKGDISQISSEEIPDFDILLAGFPCQAFSTAGARRGFSDNRGVLFFEIERILKHKKPVGFLLENVDNLVKHDHGRTFTIIETRLKELGYKLCYKVLNSSDFGVPQDRKRTYIIGTKRNTPNLDALDYIQKTKKPLSSILQSNQPLLETDFTKLLLSLYNTSELLGKSIKDKRGGENNIHSWEIELKGKISKQQKELLNLLLKKRRYKIWAEKKGINWMDGMPLTIEEIASFYNPDNIFESGHLQQMLDDLVAKDYLRFEHPKDTVEKVGSKGNVIKSREYRTDLPKGYNIVTGKLSFELNKILDPDQVAPTLMATDMARLAVVDGNGIRRLTIREGLRLFGFPEGYTINLPITKAYDLLGNTVAVPVIESVSLKLIQAISEDCISKKNNSYKACEV